MGCLPPRQRTPLSHQRSVCWIRGSVHRAPSSLNHNNAAVGGGSLCISSIQVYGYGTSRPAAGLQTFSISPRRNVCINGVSSLLDRSEFFFKNPPDNYPHSITSESFTEVVAESNQDYIINPYIRPLILKGFSLTLLYQLAYGLYTFFDRFRTLYFIGWFLLALYWGLLGLLSDVPVDDTNGTR